jgi:MarR family 2-MHQ and catechol resistance regulon transcriptional repressor
MSGLDRISFHAYYLVRMETNSTPSNPSILTLMREMSGLVQEFETCATQHVRLLGLTLPQFDVLATLGNQPPMTCKALGEKTLMLKGTMTGVLDRLEAKGLIERSPNTQDGRSMRIALSKSGQRLFRQAFPQHLAHLDRAYRGVSKPTIAQAVSALRQVRQLATKRKDNSINLPHHFNKELL